MKWVIHKHILQPSTLLQLTRGAVILTAQAQGEFICLWEMHDPTDDSKERRAFIVKGTGEEFENPPDGYRLKHIATVQLTRHSSITGEVGYLQWHVFEVEKAGLVT